MEEKKIMLLDCTLRDGGYVNDWKWGYSRAKDIIRALTRANVDVVEVGFLRNVEGYNPDITVCNRIEELNKLLPQDRGNTMYSAMAMRSNYDINKLAEYNGEGIEMIRITAHDYDIEDGMAFAQAVKSKGYKLSINPINIMGYSDEKLLWIIKQVNEIQPYQFAIVDTFGSMKRRDLDRIVNIVDYNLDKNIRVALHLHENMSLSCCLAQRFIDMHLNRPIAVDGSLMGMGRIPGNLPIELIADYLNEYSDSSYDIDNIMDAIEDYISPIKGSTPWGYTPAYFLSARFNLHRNYAEHYLEKGDLTHKDINKILSRFDQNKKTVFDAAYADKLYEEYKGNKVDDADARKKIKEILSERKVLLIAPGTSIVTFEKEICKFIEENVPIVIALNFVPEKIHCDMVFFSNSKRFNNSEKYNCPIIMTSNIAEAKGDYIIDYNSLSGSFDQGCNSLIMALKLLKDMQAEEIYVAGADGYKEEGGNYYSSNIRSYTVHGNKFNLAVADAIKKLNVEAKFLTPSEYVDK